ncbi:hypothetical protein ACLWBD_12825 [Bdellovibrio sp. HCB117]|uniref:hypothetical protein n=1 Tax=Bdellovibrio sp. HCB117 TaxID=3394359 RepID=UPI0039B4E0AC
MKKVNSDTIKAFESYLHAKGLQTRIIDPNNIDSRHSWVPGEGGFHNHTLASYGN